ncbi:MAG TPA: glycosyltransferase family 1 protein [Chloroflexi bacterium]|nr:glycosyltransferase family 1 protein [Chloroflexota bacterium]
MGGKAFRVLMIAPTPFFADRGCHVRIFEETKALQGLGNKVAICTYPLGRDLPGLEVHRTIPIPWYKKLEAGPSLHKLYIDLLLLLKTLAVARRFEPQIIHAHLHEGVVVGYVVSRLLGLPLVGDLQGSLTGELREHGFFKGWLPLFSFLRRGEMLIDRLADVIVASATKVAEELRSEFGAQKVVVALDGVDVAQFRPRVAPEEMRIYIPSGRKVVVYLGLLNRYQGIDCLLKAIPLVLGGFERAQFLIMGYPNVEHYRHMAQELGVADHVTFTGRIDYQEAPRYLALGDVAVSPKLARTESNGKLYNYMACGLPTVAFDNPVNREILGQRGVYARLGDPTSLAKALLKTLNDEAWAKELGARLRERAVEQFSWDNTARKLMECYRALVA